MADKVKETPGPWKALLDPGWGWCVKAGKKYLAFKLTEADAQIMAASWEMLQALEEIAEPIPFMRKRAKAEGGVTEHNPKDCTKCIIDAAIAKALPWERNGELR